MNDEWFEVGQVEVLRTLGLWEDKVEKEEEAEPGVERHPAYYEESPGFSQEGQGKHDEVDQPWCRLGWVTQAE